MAGGSDRERYVPTTKIQGQIETLEERIKKLKAKKLRMEARQRTIDSRRTRRDDTRRKILVGAIVMAKVEQGVLEEATLRGWLDEALTRDDDRALFAFLKPAADAAGASP